MSRTIIILLVALGSSLQLYGQAERKALQSIKKAKWEKAYYHLTRGRYYDSLKVVAPFAWMAYYSSLTNPEFNLDSANAYARRTLRSYGASTPREKEKLKRLEIDSLVISKYIHNIDSSGFSRAKQINSTESLQHFINSFPGALQQPLAMRLRDESAFQEAVAIHSYQAYQEYMLKYPQAHRVKEATGIYERLLFESITSDGNLSSYERFIAEHPGTSYQLQAERNIFEILTASGSVEHLTDFIISHPSNHYSTVARNILFHLIPEDQRFGKFPKELLNDSLKNVPLDSGYLVPYLHGSKFGFMDKTGSPVIAAELDELNDSYLCGDISDDVLVLRDSVVAHNGAVILKERVDATDYLGHGFLLGRRDSCQFIFHKSGFRIGGNCVDDATMLESNLLAIRKDLLWGLYALNGKQLLAHEWDEISVTNDVLFLKSKEKYTLLGVSSVYHPAAKRKPYLAVVADDASVWSSNQIWVKKDSIQMVVTRTLDTLFYTTGKSLRRAYFGFTVHSPEGVYCVNNHRESSGPFEQILIHNRQLAVRSKDSWRLYDPYSSAYGGPAYDSISFLGQYTLGFRGDSLVIHFPDKRKLRFRYPVQVSLLPAKDSISYVVVSKGISATVYSSSGSKLFTGPFSRLQYLTNDVFMFFRNDKVGLVSANGKIIFPATMDAIASAGGPYVSLLRDGRFGLFDASNEKRINPQYSKNLGLYNSKYLTAYKDGRYGFISWDNKPAGKFEFQEIRYWNDTTALVRKDLQWMIYEIKTGNVLQDKIKNFKLIRDDDEKLAIVQVEHSYGVIHNKKGMIIPLSYTDIVNVGSPYEPLYFAEKHVEEASVFVVIYYTAAGKMVRKEVYDQDDYDRIYCPNN